MAGAAAAECLSALEDIQSVIDGRVAHLNGLRDLPASDLTQHEMRTVENRLIQLFGRQLAKKNGLDAGSRCEQLNRYPDFKQWLHVIDVHSAASEMLRDKLQSVGSLIDMGESEIRTVMKLCGCREKEISRLLDAVKSLKRAYISQLAKDRQAEDGSPVELGVEQPGSEMSRSRSSSPSESSSPEQKRPSLDSIISESSETPSVPITPPPFNNSVFNMPIATPPPTPTSKRGRGKGTPPPSKKLNLPLPSIPTWTSSDPQINHGPMIGETATLNRLQHQQQQHLHRSGLNLRRHSEDHESLHSSPARRGINVAGSVGLLTDIDSTQKSNKLHPPKSPRTQHRNTMLHAIKHRWSLRPHRFSKKVPIRPQTCDYCHSKIVLQGYKCKDCKYVCHSDCKFQAEKVPSCGLPRKYEEVFRDHIEGGLSSSPIMPHKPARHDPPVCVASSTGDSSSNPSSTTSSTPSSPAPFSNSMTPPSPAHPSPSPRMTNSVPQFKFPPDILDNNENIRSISSDRSDRTITIESREINDFTDSERTIPDQVEPVDEASDSEHTTIPVRKNSQKLHSEWDIPYEQLEILDLIGTGRFGAVHKGKWHGDVAIKMMDIDTNDEKQLQAFKREVSIFRKTRHDFVVLFMGACMRPPHLAIVTSLCKGQTLYTHIHLRKDRFNMNKTIQIATQIAQGMGYLHARGILHKDLKSKNIFIENGKVVITDFALFSLGRLSKQKTRKDCLMIPDGWLCYLAPELITSLRINTDGNSDMELPFSDKSDVYAFGTVWYELLAGEWPFHKQPVETVIWQVGKGLKQPLCHLQASRDVKDILMMCWSYHPESRPMFLQIKKTILRLPKKKGLHRSPSHPLHLSRSAESVL